MENRSKEPLPRRPRMVYMGTPDFSVPPLRSLIQAGHEVVGVVTQPDRPRGRGRKKIPSPVKEESGRYGLDVLQPESVNRPDFLDLLREKAPDLIVVVAFGQILKAELLSVAPWGVINIHASLLPRYRGAAPIQWAVLQNEKRTGLTLMQMDEGLDTGPILFQEEVEIRENEPAGDLHDRLAELSGPFLVRSLASMAEAPVAPRPQDDTRATYTRKITRGMTEIDWSEPAIQVAARIRALDPLPGAVTLFEGRRLKLFGAAVVRADNGEGAPGEVLESEGRLVIGTGKGRISAAEIQAPGKRRMPISDFLRGFPLNTGSRFEA